MSRIYRRTVQLWIGLTVLAPIKVYAAIAAGGALPWDQPLQTLQERSAGPSGPRGHDRRNHWNWPHMGVQRTRNWCPLAVIDGLRGSGSTWRDAAHDSALSARWRRSVLKRS